jgi:hypothetical protein
MDTTPDQAANARPHITSARITFAEVISWNRSYLSAMTPVCSPKSKAGRNIDTETAEINRASRVKLAANSGSVTAIIPLPKFDIVDELQKSQKRLPST